jgi:transketolase N-terminal domain/subunit
MSQRKFLDEAGEINRLKLIAAKIRKNALENITKTKAGHPGGSLSVADILTALYFGLSCHPESGLWENILRYDPADLWPDRDRLILSRHAAPALYAALAQAGFSVKTFSNYRKIDSPLEVTLRCTESQKRKVAWSSTAPKAWTSAQALWATACPQVQAWLCMQRFTDMITMCM